MYLNAHQTCEGNVEIYFMTDVSEIPESFVSTKFTLDVMGLKITTLSQEPVNHSQLLNWKSFIKVVKVVIHDYGTFSYIELFVHTYELLNLIGHGGVMGKWQVVSRLLVGTVCFTV